MCGGNATLVFGSAENIAERILVGIIIGSDLMADKGERYADQRGATGKGGVTNGRDTVRNGRLSQGCAAGEGVVTDQGNRFGNAQLC